MNIDERLELYQGMVLCCHNLYLWRYDRDMNLLGSNCPEEAVVNTLLAMGESRDLTQFYAQRRREPMLMTNDVGLMWVADPERDEETGELSRIHVLGPFFIDEVSPEDMAANLGRMKLSPILTQVATRFLRDLPVVSISRVFEYAIMLHHCITGEKITVSDIRYQENERPARLADQQPMTDVHGTYEMEREMVRMVREGNLDYQTHMSKIAVTGSLGKLSNGDASRQMKNSVLVCIVLFSRAAIEGGLSPEIAMTLTDHYFQSVEACDSFSELAEITRTMQDDFVQRVHRCRTSKLSKPILDCCDYINMHLEEELTLKGLAAQFKYSEQYLCRKFKKELGMGFKEYIREQKLERAKAMLRDSSLSVREISDRLRFCSSSYFSENFRQQFGVSPSQWRESN